MTRSFSICLFKLIVTVLTTCSFSSGQDFGQQTPALNIKAPSQCYNELGLPQRCIPEFENAAYGVRMEATNTCGENGDMLYCTQTATSARKSCDWCSTGQFSSIYLTDLHHQQENQTWWQSETMQQGIQHPTRVNLTLHLGKAYDITYVRLVFYSTRPESFAIYKRTSEDGEWTPYQYYSATCRETYGLPDSSSTEFGSETRALCTGEYSDISPLRGGNVAFSTLEGRPSAYFFDKSAELQEWVTATDLRITLDRLNTFGDEVFADEQVLRSYWYAVADVAVGARCKCNGHASRCEFHTDDTLRQRRQCICEHNTDGPDCERCHDFYNDAPWGRASQDDVHECKACNCNGYSNRCFFDKELYAATGHGGHCLNCTANRDGPNCERCKENFYENQQGLCIPCNCDAIGSRSLQCNSAGKCQCKPGVTGEKCSSCSLNYYDFTTHGCKPCGCSEAGSYYNEPNCDPNSGICRCKANVEGKRCRECKPGYFNLDSENEYGCTPCFCYGHSSECQPALDYFKITVESTFVRNIEKWTAQNDKHIPAPLDYVGFTRSISVKQTGAEPMYFVASDRYLGDQRASYNRDLKFTLRIGNNTAYSNPSDLILEGAGTYVSMSIIGQNNNLPSVESNEYKFRLNEHSEYGWSPKLSARAFMTILSNLTAIRIRGTYSPNGVGYLDNVRLETAHRGAAGQPALWVEMCSCPNGYVGQFCESCAPGYRHSPVLGGPYVPCIPCDCNGHADICDSETGRCICEHNTSGDNCELCARGYYGNALNAKYNDCTKCPCPNNGACIQMQSNEGEQTIVCTECPTGYAGTKCDLCSDGYFGDPTGKYGPAKDCAPCDCNLNVDANAVGNCNRTTGECLKCIYNTAGRHCDECLNGYYGDALAPTKGDCHQCECYSTGTIESEEGPPKCDPLNGQCACRPHVQGRNCDKCQEGYFNIISGEGCDACNCNSEGSYNSTCDLQTGQCYCKPGVTGLQCDQCKAYQYGFSTEGCKECLCDDVGSRALQCDPYGQCPCFDNVEGHHCDRCKENKYDRKRGCVNCPSCYNLVQDAVDDHRGKLENLESMLSEIQKNPTVISDNGFDAQLAKVKQEIEELAQQANVAASAGEGDKTLAQRLIDLGDKLEHIQNMLNNVLNFSEDARKSASEGESNIGSAEEIIGAAKYELDNLKDLVKSGDEALAKASNRSKQVGEQSSQMSKIAQEARNITERLEQETKNIKMISEKAYNTSLEAYKLAKDGMGQQSNISNELVILAGEVISAETRVGKVREMSKQALDRSKEVYEEALDIYAQVNSTNVPKIDVKSIKKDAAALITEAKIIEELAKTQKSKYQDVLQSMANQVERARELLELGGERQSDIDNILETLEEINLRAEAAEKQATTTKEDAEAIHKTLKEFSNEVQISRQKAEQELETIPDIQNKVEEAQNMIASVINDLELADQNAKMANSVAQEANHQYAKQASEEASEIRVKATATKQDAGTLHDEAVQLSGRVTETGRNIDILRKRTDYDAQLTTDAKIRVGQAKTDASEAVKLVEKATADVKTIEIELQNLPNLNDSDLDKLEQHLREAEDEMQKADLKGRISVLQDAKNAHQKWIKDYQDESVKLQSEVENVKRILEALPDGCFRTVGSLEPK